MAISKVIYQTYKTSKLPFVTKWHINRLKKKNPAYDYQFYDDARIEEFLRNEFDEEVFQLYKKITIGAAKADFFRYAILYKKGGIYLDIDSLIVTKIDNFILPTDSAVIALESNLEHFVQYVLFFEAGHPFLKKTIELILENLRENKFPNDVHKMTGPTVFSEAIRACVAEMPSVKYREMGIDFEGHVKFSYPMSKFFLYGISRKNHWKKQIQQQKVLSS